ncbi:MAG: ABC transporter ATP-binding protein [Fusobacteriaceae bacterium]|jgi:oligopeptide transport system ATP-binding protein|nr:ABC transporter ATP-binding protein [Fusobacteriaceae bacterium]MBP6468179.1 ABC transporter ATP-binding protein [Fusobacteriaceae bacterium]MBP9596816.1 ABC transporter ATP-binding protein [Fusobacteriaceae bacterium]MBU9918757.1 ABC transporter ATP-binding protein [Fusobacteriaceae bacterium]
MSEKILDVKNLHVYFDTYAGVVKAIRDVSFHVNKGESLAIVGESGSGKSVTVQTVMKLIPMPPGRIASGEILFKDRDIVKMNEAEMRKIRGGEIGMIFQDPMTSLNPTMTVGKQIAEGIMMHQKVSHKEAMAKALEMLKAVNIPNPEERLNSYPHQFSGGMRQRVVIAIALACNPDLLIADEPTTALDVTVQAQILDLMNELKSKMNTAIILITHDLGVVADLAERVIVMYGGEIMEEASVHDIFKDPKHPYTWGLIKSIPRLDIDREKEKLSSIDGTPPDLFNPPVGCPFAPRCEYAMEICKKEKPGMINGGNNHRVSCWLLDERAETVTNPVTGKSTKE